MFCRVPCLASRVPRLEEKVNAVLSPQHRTATLAAAGLSFERGRRRDAGVHARWAPNGTVKAMTPEELTGMGAQIVLGNTST